LIENKQYKKLVERLKVIAYITNDMLTYTTMTVSPEVNNSKQANRLQS